MRATVFMEGSRRITGIWHCLSECRLSVLSLTCFGTKAALNLEEIVSELGLMVKRPPKTGLRRVPKALEPLVLMMS